MQKVLITGATGQIGSALVASAPNNVELYLAARHVASTQVGGFQVDLSQQSLVQQLLADVQPQIIINAAAWTDVDGAQTQATAAYQLNARLPDWLADYAEKNQVQLVHYSTDYVFNGDQSSGYRETDSVAPRTVYGQTKLAGETAILNKQVAALILRTSWVYGGPTANFLTTIANKLLAAEALKVVDDQIGCPSWSHDIAVCTWHALSCLPVQPSFKPVIYHLAGCAKGSWYDFAKQIEQALAELSMLTYDAAINSLVSPCTTADYPRPAKRPKYSVLNSESFARQFGQSPSGWQSVSECLQRCLPLKKSNAKEQNPC